MVEFVWILLILVFPWAGQAGFDMKLSGEFAHKGIATGAGATTTDLRIPVIIAVILQHYAYSALQFLYRLQFTVFLVDKLKNHEVLSGDHANDRAVSAEDDQVSQAELGTLRKLATRSNWTSP